MVRLIRVMLMKAIVLAGGYATRLWPMTKYIAKPLIPLKGKPVIDHIIAKIEKLPEVDEIIVSTNKRFEEQFRHWLETHNWKKPVKLEIEPTVKQGEKFGAIKAIYHVIKSNNITGDVLIIAGDNVFGLDMEKFMAFFRSHKKPTIALYDVKDRETAKQLGIVKLEGNKIVDFVEKPENPPSTLASTLIYAMPADFHGKLEQYMSNGFSKDSPGKFIEWLHKNTDVMGYVFDDHWFDIGTFDSYEKCLQFYKDLNGVKME